MTVAIAVWMVGKFRGKAIGMLMVELPDLAPPASCTQARVFAASVRPAAVRVIVSPATNVPDAEILAAKPACTVLV